MPKLCIYFAVVETTEELPEAKDCGIVGGGKTGPSQKMH